MRIKDILSESVVSPKIGYHVTSDKNLSTILKHGFKPDKRGQTYFWGDRDMAEWFSDYQNDNNEPRTILRVNLSGVNLVPDSEAEDMSEWSSRFEPGTPGNAWITTDQISPDRIIQ
jgi:hypothetical protein